MRTTHRSNYKQACAPRCIRQRITLRLLTLVLTTALLGGVMPAWGELQLPNWAGKGANDLKAEISNIGQRVTGIISSVVAVLSVIAMLAGAAMFPAGRAEDGKRWIISSAVGLIIAGSVYGIAGLFIS